MGGKDAIVVDNETDVEKAAAAVTASAFGYQGQKCSACSRAIVVDSVYDTFLDRLKAAWRKSPWARATNRPVSWARSLTPRP